MKTTKEFFKLYSTLYQFEEGPNEHLVDEEDFEKALKEYAQQAIIEDRKNVAEHATTEWNEEWDDSYGHIKLYSVDKGSIINAPQIELK